MDTLAKRFQRTRSSMYRVINEIRAQRLLDQALDFIPNVSFEDQAMAAVIEADMPDLEDYEESRRRMRAPKDAPPELASLYEVPLLSKEQEQHLFRKMNYLKFKARKLLEKLKLPSGKVNTAQLRTQDLERVESLLAQASGSQGPAHQLQHAAGGGHRQAACRPGRQLLRAAVRRQHVADPGGREVRLQPGQQVQHLCELGDHEELRPQHPGGEAPPRALRDRQRGDVRRRGRHPLQRARDRGHRRAGQHAASIACWSSSTRANARSSACGPASIPTPRRA